MRNRVKVIKGDIFQSRAQTLVNTVNCVGIMGKGLALEFKNRFPGMYKDYVRRWGAKKDRSDWVSPTYSRNLNRIISSTSLQKATGGPYLALMI